MTRLSEIFQRKNLAWLWLIAFASLFPLYHAFAYIGHFGFDDLQYAEISAELANGLVDWNDHFSYRWAIIGATALSYKIFGVNDFASSLPALFISLATLGLIFTVVKKHGPWAVVAGLGLFTLNHWTLFYSDKLMPDVYVAFFCTAAILVYYDVQHHQGTIFRPLLFSLFLLGAFLSKETVVLIIPLLGWWLIRDIIQKQNARFWLMALSSGLILMTIYLFLVGQFTGDPLGRFRAILNNQYVNFCNYADQPVRETVKRVSFGLLRELTHQGMMAGFILLLPALILNRGKRENKSLKFFTITSVILLLSSNFMTITPTGYNPMCTDPRHYLFLIPIFSISGTLALVSFYSDRRYWWLVLVTTVLLSVLLIPIKSQSLFELMYPLLGISLTGILITRTKLLLSLCTVLLIIAMAVKPARYILYAREVNYQKQKEFVLKMLPPGSFDRVITDEVQKKLIFYYRGFRDTIPELFDWQEANAMDNQIHARIALLINPYSGYLSSDQPGEMPFFAANPGIIAKKTAEDKALKIALYETDHWKKPQIIAQFRHDFEGFQQRWTPADSKPDSIMAVQGKFANQPGEYSSTFRFPSDSLNLKGYDRLLIDCRVQFLAMEKTKASLIISLGNNQGEDIYESIELFSQVKSLATWSPVVFRTLFPVNKIRQGSEFAVYIWNNPGDKIYVDDWEIVFSTF